MKSSERELVQAVERVEPLIATDIREEGFEYVFVADYETVRGEIGASLSFPGISEEEFIEKHGFGVSTLYTGSPPQLTEGDCPARVGLREQNVQIYNNLSPADQVS